MSKTVDGLRQKVRREIEYYAAKNDILKRELSNLEETFNSNMTRLEIIRRDYEESEEMIRIMKLLTR